MSMRQKEKKQESQKREIKSEQKEKKGGFNLTRLTLI